MQVKRTGKLKNKKKMLKYYKNLKKLKKIKKEKLFLCQSKTKKQIKN